jgi:hypothetical protein
MQQGGRPFPLDGLLQERSSMTAIIQS